MRYAFNVADLHTYVNDHEYKIMVQCMIYPVLDRDPGSTFFVDARRIDENGILVKEDITEERMGAIVQLVREGLGQRKGLAKHQLRIYQSKTGRGGWKRI